VGWRVSACGGAAGMPLPSGQIPPPWAQHEHEAHAARAARTSSQAAGSALWLVVLGEATSGPSGVLLGLGTDVGDQFGPQVVLGELVAEPGDGKADHVTGRQGQLVQACLGGEAAEPSPLLVGDVDG